MKMDMMKAYNRVNCNFMKNMLRAMGFCTNWIGLVFRTVYNNYFSVLVNGESCGFFKADMVSNKGIRYLQLCLF